MDTKALRQKILDLAIRGKLVPQDPNDEPASVLLERIRAEKQKMVKEGKLKAKDIKNDSVIYKDGDNLHYEKFADGTVKCIEDEIPFDIPDSWAWTRLDDICCLEIKRGKAPKYVEKSNVVVFAQKCNTKSGKVNLSLAQFLDERLLKKYSSADFMQYGDIIINSTGTGTLGRVGIFEKIDDCFDLPIVPDTHITTIRLFNSFTPKFVYYYLKFNQAIIESKGEGSTNQKELRPDYLRNILVPVPPIPEQKQIASIVVLAFNNVSTIETHKMDISSLIVSAKSRILDLAIRGKLVPQDPNDEPASVLLEHIKAEKEKLIKQGKIKREKTESTIFKGEDNSYYEKVPVGWVPVNFCNICELLSGRDLKKSEYSDAEVGIPYIIGASNFDNGNIIIERWTNNPQVVSFKNDILLTCKGTVGELAFNTCGDVHIARQVMSIRNKTTILPEYLMLLMKYSINNVKQKAKGLIPGISREDITNLHFLIPPLKEQKRILKRVHNATRFLSIIEASLD